MQVRSCAISYQLNRPGICGGSNLRDGVTSEELAPRIKALEREVKELHQANEILKWARTFFSQARPQTQDLKDFVDQHRDTYGVRTNCKVLQIAPLGCRRHAACYRKPDLRSSRAKTNDTLMPQKQQVW